MGGNTGLTSFQEIDRPKRRRAKADELVYDQELEDALRATLTTGRAIVVPLARFHSSPAKVRLWKDGLLLRHRIQPDRQNVAAWVDQEEDERFVATEDGKLF